MTHRPASARPRGGSVPTQGPVRDRPVGRRSALVAAALIPAGLAGAGSWWGVAQWRRGMVQDESRDAAQNVAERIAAARADLRASDPRAEASTAALASRLGIALPALAPSAPPSSAAPAASPTASSAPRSAAAQSSTAVTGVPSPGPLGAAVNIVRQGTQPGAAGPAWQWLLLCAASLGANERQLTDALGDLAEARSANEALSGGESHLVEAMVESSRASWWLTAQAARGGQAARSRAAAAASSYSLISERLADATGRGAEIPLGWGLPAGAAPSAEATDAQTRCARSLAAALGQTPGQAPQDVVTSSLSAFRNLPD
ncbi:hypothetical protein [Falsarthrobacter nasiphocae]|uniref:Uncharacterized protein n=1 Tax=Falsarthrobacter nasiphocae TaxID=189863 RepID=A0AAE3YIM6_9MICC|nr:hypothetical protein [Falsarthrobacter nasiphocae]MDR6892648.1 hypothetical protein [Falsarthrobacter nasiphocae]